MHPYEIVKEAVEEIINWPEDKLASFELFTCIQIRCHIRAATHDYHIAQACFTILNNRKDLFVEDLNKKVAHLNKRISTDNFIHDYCVIIYNDEESIAPYLSPEFLATRKEWLNFIIAEDIGELNEPF